MRTIITDYSEKDSTRLWLTGALYAAVAVTLLIGTLHHHHLRPLHRPGVHAVGLHGLTGRTRTQETR